MLTILFYSLSGRVFGSGRAEPTSSSFWDPAGPRGLKSTVETLNWHMKKNTCPGNLLS